MKLLLRAIYYLTKIPVAGVEKLYFRALAIALGCFLELEVDKCTIGGCHAGAVIAVGCGLWSWAGPRCLQSLWHSRHYVTRLDAMRASLQGGGLKSVPAQFLQALVAFLSYGENNSSLIGHSIGGNPCLIP